MTLNSDTLYGYLQLLLTQIVLETVVNLKFYTFRNQVHMYIMYISNIIDK